MQSEKIVNSITIIDFSIITLSVKNIITVSIKASFVLGIKKETTLKWSLFFIESKIKYFLLLIFN